MGAREGLRVPLAVGYAITLLFVLAGSALHAYADAQAVAARDAIRVTLVAIVGANAVGATFFAVRAIPVHPLLGSLGAFAVALGPATARFAVIAATRAEERRNAALAEVAEDDGSVPLLSANAVGEREGRTSGSPDAGSDGSMSTELSDGVIRVPADALVVLVGAAGCGKSVFASRRFAPSQVVSSDECRVLVSDDVRKPSSDAFRLMYQLIGMRLKRGRLTVADATNVTADKRAELLAIARQYRRDAVAVVFDLPEQLCRDRNEARRDRVVPVPAIRGQMRHVRDSLPHLAEEGFAEVHVLRTAEDLDDVRVEAVETGKPKKRASRS